MAQKQSTLRTWILGISASIAGALLLAAIWLIVDVRDFVKYSQPDKDRRQDQEVRTIAKQIRVNDSIQCEKNSNTNKRIDQDSELKKQVLKELRTVQMQNEIILKHNATAKKEWEYIRRIVNETIITRNQ